MKIENILFGFFQASRSSRVVVSTTMDTTEGTADTTTDAAPNTTMGVILSLIITGIAIPGAFTSKAVSMTKWS